MMHVKEAEGKHSGMTILLGLLVPALLCHFITLSRTAQVNKKS